MFSEQALQRKIQQLATTLYSASESGSDGENPDWSADETSPRITKQGHSVLEDPVAAPRPRSSVVQGPSDSTSTPICPCTGRPCGMLIEGNEVQGQSPSNQSDGPKSFSVLQPSTGDDSSDGLPNVSTDSGIVSMRTIGRAMMAFRDTVAKTDARDAEDGVDLPSATDSEPEDVIDITASRKCPNTENTTVLCDKGFAIGEKNGGSPQKPAGSQVYHINEEGFLKEFKDFGEMQKYIEEASRSEKAQENSGLAEKLKLSIPKMVHYSSLGEYLHLLYDKGACTDVNITVEGCKFAGHRLALSCHSEYFRDLFEKHSERRTPCEVKLIGVGKEAFASFLEFVYSGYTKIYPNILPDMIIMADELRVPKLKEILDSITIKIDFHEALRRLVENPMLPTGRFRGLLLDKIWKDFIKAAKDPLFLELTVDVLIEIVSSVELLVPKESLVLLACVAWLLKDRQVRTVHATRVLQYIRFYHMTEQELFKCVQDIELMKDYKEFILVASWLLITVRLKREDPFGFKMLPARKGYLESKTQGSAGIRKSSLPPPPVPLQTSVIAPQKPETTCLGLFESIMQPKPLITSTPDSRKGDKSSKIMEISVSPETPPQAPAQVAPHETPVETPFQAPGQTPPRTFEPPQTSGEENSSSSARSPPRTPVQVPSQTPVVPSSNSARTPPRTPVQVPSQTPVGTPFQTPARTPIPTPKSEVADLPPYDDGLDVVAVCGVCSEDDADSMYLYRYDPVTNQWIHYCLLPMAVNHHAVARIHGTIYLVGGFVNKNGVKVQKKSMHCLDLASQMWSRGTDMAVARSRHCLCQLFGMLYAIGGMGEHGVVLYSVECYNPHTGMWSAKAPMNQARFSASAAVLQGKIYVVGGRKEGSGCPDVESVRNTAECYNPITNCWTLLGSTLRLPRCNAGLVAAKGHLYICGGLTKSFASDPYTSQLISSYSVDEYLPLEDTWKPRANMNLPRHSAGVTVVGSKIFIVGGASSPHDQALQSVECYDVDTGTWLPGKRELPAPVSWISCVTIPCE